MSDSELNTSLSAAKRMAHSCHLGGGPVLAAIVAHTGGRWATEFASSERFGLSEWVGKACAEEEVAANVGAGPAQLSKLVGFAVFQGWRWVQGRTKTLDARMLIELIRRTHKAKDGHYLEHEVLSSCCLLNRLPVRQLCDPGWEHVQPRISGGAILASCAQLQEVVKVNHDGSHRFLSELLNQWQSTYQISAGDAFAWVVDWRMAVSLASGNMAADVSSLMRQGSGSASCRAPHAPPDKWIRFMKKQVVPQLGSLQAAQPLDDVGISRPGKRKFSAAHAIRAIRFASHIKQMKKFQPAVAAAGQFLFPKTWAALRPSSCIEDSPSKTALAQLALRFDIAGMLFHRRWYQLSRPAFRYLAYDASPKQGTELFCAVERIVLAKDLLAMEDDGEYPIVQRKMPLCQLGNMRLSTADKIATLIHQTWLDYGPSIEAVRSANSDVRTCLSDMGTELSIADSADVCASVLLSAENFVSGEVPS